MNIPNTPHMTAKFIELHIDGEAMMINIAHLSEVHPQDDGAIIWVDACTQDVDESYEQIKNTLSRYMDTAVIGVSEE